MHGLHYKVLPQPGQHWVTTEDMKTMKEDKVELVACSMELDEVAGGQAMAAKELGRLTRKIDNIKDCQARCVEVGLPGCKFQLDRALVELERGKACLSAKAPNNDLYAALVKKLHRLQVHTLMLDVALPASPFALAEH